MSRSTWTLGTPIRTDARLVEILTAIERQCLRTSVELDARDLVLYDRPDGPATERFPEGAA